jgi:hypothetical protein
MNMNMQQFNILNKIKNNASKYCFGQKLSHGFGLKTDIVCSNFGRFYKFQWVHLILHVHRKSTGEHAIIFYPISQTYRIIN